MKVFESSCTFSYPWDEVSKANWRKYCAWNDKSTHVVSVDTLSRTINENGILRTERLIGCKQAAPRWIAKIFGANCETSRVYEVSYVDPTNKTVTMKSMNLDFNNILSVQETVVYRPDPTNATEQTQFEQAAHITAYGYISQVRSAIEDFSVSKFGENARLGKEGFEKVLRKSVLENEAISKAWDGLRNVRDAESSKLTLSS